MPVRVVLPGRCFAVSALGLIAACGVAPITPLPSPASRTEAPSAVLDRAGPVRGGPVHEDGARSVEPARPDGARTLRSFCTALADRPLARLRAVGDAVRLERSADGRDYRAVPGLDLADRSVRAVLAGPGADELLLLADTAHDGSFRLYALDSTTNRLAPLPLPAGVIAADVDRARQRIACLVSTDNGRTAQTTLRVLDRGESADRIVFRDRPTLRVVGDRVVLAPDGSTAYCVASRGAAGGGPVLLAIALDAGADSAESVLLDPELPQLEVLPRWLDEQELLVLAGDAQTKDLYGVDRRSGRPLRLTDLSAKVRDAAVLPGEAGALLAVVQRDDLSVLQLLDTFSGSVLAERSLHGRVDLLEVDAGRALLVREDRRTPPREEVVSIVREGIEFRLVAPDSDELREQPDERTVIEVENRPHGRDDRRFHAVLRGTDPGTPVRAALVVLRDDLAPRFDPSLERLRANGVAVLEVLDRAGAPERWLGDHDALARFCGERLSLPAGRIGLAACAALASRAAAVLRLHESPADSAFGFVWLHGSTEPVADLERISVPLLLTHGGNDHEAPVQASRDTWQRARELGRDVQYVEISGAGPECESPLARRTLEEALLAFLQGVLDRAPRTGS